MKDLHVARCLRTTFLFHSAGFGLLKGPDGWLSLPVNIYSSRLKSPIREGCLIKILITIQNYKANLALIGLKQTLKSTRNNNLYQVWNMKIIYTENETNFAVCMSSFWVSLNSFNCCRNLKKLLYYKIFESAVYLRGHLLYRVTSSRVVWLSALSFNKYLNSHMLCFILHQSTGIRSWTTGSPSDHSL